MHVADQVFLAASVELLYSKASSEYVCASHCILLSRCGRIVAPAVAHHPHGHLLVAHADGRVMRRTRHLHACRSAKRARSSS